MNEDVNDDESMQRFEDLGRKLFQATKLDDDTEDVTEEEPQGDE